MEAISRSCLPEAAARTKRQRKATCCGVLGAASHRTTCSRSSAAKLTSGLILAMRTHISYWPQYVYLFMIHTTRLAALSTLGTQEAEHSSRTHYPGQTGHLLHSFRKVSKCFAHSVQADALRSGHFSHLCNSLGQLLFDGLIAHGNSPERWMKERRRFGDLTGFFACR